MGDPRYPVMARHCDTENSQSEQSFTVIEVNGLLIAEAASHVVLISTKGGCGKSPENPFSLFSNNISLERLSNDDELSTC